MADKRDVLVARDVWVVQQSIFGDYGNGRIYGVFLDEDAAVELESVTRGVQVVQAVLWSSP